MAMIDCPECKAKISDKANSCPKCGLHIANTTIELTNKKWKLTKLIAWVLIILGAIMFPIGFGGSTTAGAFGGLFLMIGIPLLCVGKIGTWWSNK